MKRIAINAALITLSVTLALALAELAVRAFYPRFANYNLEMWRYFATLKEPLPDKDLPFVNFPNKEGTFYGVRVKINSQGFRCNEFSPEKTAGKKRIVVLGDSLVFGWGVAQKDTIPQVLENKLNSGAERYEVLNMGVGNYNSTMEVEFFKKKGLALRPDMVILVYFVNDVEPIPRLSKLGYQIKSRSYLLAILFDRYVKLRSRLNTNYRWCNYYLSLYNPGAPALADNRAALKELAGLCRENHIPLLIASYPELHQLDDYPLSVATDYIRGLTAEVGVPFVDLRPRLAAEDPKSLWVSVEDTHGNAKACRIVAEEILDAMTAN